MFGVLSGDLLCSLCFAWALVLTAKAGTHFLSGFCVSLAPGMLPKITLTKGFSIHRAITTPSKYRVFRYTLTLDNSKDDLSTIMHMWLLPVNEFSGTNDCFTITPVHPVSRSPFTIFWPKIPCRVFMLSLHDVIWDEALTLSVSDAKVSFVFSPCACT